MSKKGDGPPWVRKGMVPHEVYNEVLPRCKAQWPVEYWRRIKGERYQEQVPGTEA